MEKEDAFKRAIELFLAVLFGGVVSFFIGKFYETGNWHYFIVCVGVGIFIIGFFFILYKKAY